MTMKAVFIFIIILTLTLTNHVIHADQSVVQVTLIHNATEKGALCLDGTPGAYFVSKGDPSLNKWIIYLLGGAWCTSEDNCKDRATMFQGSSINATYAQFHFILSPDPNFYNWNRVIVYYCDGASFMADVEEVDPKNNLHLRGRRIFKAVMEEILAVGMIHTTDALLMGDSAGGLATMLNCDLFRSYLPNTCNVKCIADSGFFIRGQNLPGLEKREQFFNDVAEFHNLVPVLPSSCTLRVINPSLCLFPENFIADIQTPLFILNSAFDSYQTLGSRLDPPVGDTNWGFCRANLSNCTPFEIQYFRDFRTTFLTTLSEVGHNPSRGLFISSCFIHGFWLKNTTKNQKIFSSIGDWVNGIQGSYPYIDPMDSPFYCGQPIY